MSAPSVPSPTPPNFTKELEQIYAGQAATAPGYLALEQQLAPQYAQLNLGLSQQFAPQQAKLQTDILGQDIANQPLLSKLNTQAMGLSDKLTPQETRQIDQQTRGQFAAAGMEHSTPSVVTDFLNRDQFQRQKQFQNMAAQQGVQQLNDVWAGYGQPGAQSQFPGISQGQGMFNNAPGQLTQQYGQYQQNVFNQGLANANLSGQWYGGLIGAGADIIGGVLGGLAMSDKRVKTGIKKTGDKTSQGIPIKEFSFKGSPRRFRGVIAQDVEKKIPHGIVHSPTGLKMINRHIVDAPIEEVPHLMSRQKKPKGLHGYQDGGLVEPDTRPPAGPKEAAGLYEPSPYTQEHGAITMEEAQAILDQLSDQGPNQFSFQDGGLVTMSERSDLLNDAESAFYGGGNAPPTPTPTPTPRPQKGDDMLIKAQHGEYVIPADVVQKKGTDFFDKMIEQSSDDGNGSSSPSSATSRWKGAEAGAAKGLKKVGERFKHINSGPMPGPGGMGYNPRGLLGFRRGGLVLNPRAASGNITIRGGGPDVGGNRQRFLGGIDFPPANMGADPLYDNFGSEPGTGGRGGGPGSNYGNFPPANTPGFAQGPTLIPTTFDAQGYPNAISTSLAGVGNPDWWRYF